MASEIQVTAGLTVNKNGAIFNQQFSRVADMAGDQATQNVQIIGTSAEALSLGDTATVGWVMVKNLDNTNFVVVSMANDATTPFAKLLPGDWALFKAASATMYAKADTASCNCLVFATEL